MSDVPASRSFPFSQPAPATGIVDRDLSTSFITALTEDGQDRVRAKVKSIIEGEPSLSGHDVIGFPNVTELHLFRKHQGHPSRPAVYATLTSAGSGRPVTRRISLPG